ncbi:Uncharacterised protein [Megamonas hypermegale]|uniref:Helix-turn-helix domain n=1 Tax=Megamonas hypermegale TaxID=158847 RepID=A0A239U5I5_9FIRM|nr:hypothetical protein [Megamonas hypermegale]SNV04909.1 Uncharacterised protein [Megamonas hypermegale]
MGTIADTLVDIRIKNNDVYVQLKHILKLYDISRCTLWRLLNEMRLIPKYQKAFRDVSPQKKLVHLASFEEFIKDKHKKYMRE